MLISSRALRVVVAAMALGLTACASTSSITETKSVPSGLAAYPSLAVHVANAPDDSEGKWSAYFASALATSLKDKGVFSRVVTEPNGTGDVVLDMKFTRLDIPHGAATTFAGSMTNAEVALEGALTKPGSSDSLGSFTVTGNSKGKTRVSVGGFGVQGPDSYTKTAIEEAADRLATFLATKK